MVMMCLAWGGRERDRDGEREIFLGLVVLG